MFMYERVYLLFICIYVLVEHFNFPTFQMVVVCLTFCGWLPKVCDDQGSHAVGVSKFGLLGFSTV